MKRRSFLTMAGRPPSPAPSRNCHRAGHDHDPLVVPFRQSAEHAGRVGGEVRAREPRHQGAGRGNPVGRRRQRLRDAPLRRHRRRQSAGLRAGQADNQARLMEMDALAPLDDMLKGWAGRADIAGESLGAAPREQRQAVLPAAALRGPIPLLPARPVPGCRRAAPKTFDEFLAAAKATTEGGGVFGFGMRGGGGGQDNWGAFVLGGGRRLPEGRHGLP